MVSSGAPAWIVTLIPALAIFSMLAEAFVLEGSRPREIFRRHQSRRQTTHLRVSDLLYQEHEKLLVQRGILEDELVPTSGCAPLKANVVRGSGRAGGFGGGGSAASSTSNAKTAAKAHAKVLKRDGVVRIDNVLSSDLADRLREYVLDLRTRAEHDVQSGSVPPLQRFADVLLKVNRCDLTMPLGDPDAPVVAEGLLSILNGPAGYTMTSILGNSAILQELSCLISNPGSQRQVMHPDTPFLEGRGPVLYTCFVALQDVTLSMGPTVWLPGTHTAQAHEAFADESMTSASAQTRKDELLTSTKSVVGLLPKGCCAIFDSRCLHCGTANTATEGDTSRAIFYCSLKDATVANTGNPASIRPEWAAAQASVKDLRTSLIPKNVAGSIVGRVGATLV